jgi:tRNA(adenine34) deaminase
MTIGALTHKDFMHAALREAEKAYAENEVPVGAVIAHNGRIIARAHNQKETLCDPTAHAEMIAITQAASVLENWCLAGCAVYVTLEPCAMCAGALVLTRADALFIAARDQKTGACGSVLDITGNPHLNHQLDVTFGLMEEESSALLREFFWKKRIRDD